MVAGMLEGGAYQLACDSAATDLRRDHGVEDDQDITIALVPDVTLVTINGG